MILNTVSTFCLLNASWRMRIEHRDWHSTLDTILIYFKNNNSAPGIITFEIRGLKAYIKHVLIYSININCYYYRWILLVSSSQKTYNRIDYI